MNLSTRYIFTNFFDIRTFCDAQLYVATRLQQVFSVSICVNITMSAGHTLPHTGIISNVCTEAWKKDLKIVYYTSQDISSFFDEFWVTIIWVRAVQPEWNTGKSPASIKLNMLIFLRAKIYSPIHSLAEFLHTYPRLISYICKPYLLNNKSWWISLGNHPMINKIFCFEAFLRYSQIVRCECTEAYAGDYCTEDRNGCLLAACFPNVTCTDVPAPGVGEECGDCPEGTTGEWKILRYIQC